MGSTYDYWDDERKRYVCGQCYSSGDEDAEIARLREERDASRLISEGLHLSNVKLRAELEAAKAERDSARAALDGEREACDQYRIGGGLNSWDKRRHDYCHPMPDGRNEWRGTDQRCELCRSVDARRAAEAKGEPK